MAQKVEGVEIGGNRVTVIKQDRRVGKVATIILRGATDHLMDDMERAIDDGVNTFKALCKDARILPGGGATEMALSQKLLEYGRKQTGLEQYAIQKFAEALEVIPLTLAENAGMNTTDTLAALRAQHAQGNGSAHVAVADGGEGGDELLAESRTRVGERQRGRVATPPARFLQLSPAHLIGVCAVGG